MSCPDWQRLTALRERDPDAEPPGWREALAHLDGCPACAAAALAADPLLVFRRLPRPAVREEEVAALGAEVLALVRAGRREARRPRRRGFWRGAAAAALVGAALLLEPGAGALRPGPGVTVAALAAEPAAPPLLDGLEASSARVYELGGDGLALVMVVDASLDV
ncbi:MAG: hypothetical protein GX178_12070 [Acidobacteria bacterium]|jgi:hypothetical protein|nr:hypothetical protein [Thermoanaerobaculia bacterium]NLN12324.1 hypothetical protein [Acidobacteriota bacterium]MBP7814056.1 hypothetical protein [Thermoanaerobaculia bacterium]MBP8845501.1 hypothetical protein [Thermoanaerobaculia bacterium]HNU82838.1 hypothetical protein [Thermoanaerobaculia bacterium]